jgi:prepilin-type N-terminal cleavage/methylation domain-containing protein
LRKKCRGFTLVEVIVVLVILAILAAIAIPALTGYIDKAQDKQYIAEARNVSVAMKAVLSEAYASGEINDVIYESNPYMKYSSLYWFTYLSPFPNNQARFNIYQLSVCANRNSAAGYDYFRRAAALIGEAYPANDAMETTRIWEYYPVTAKGSDTTAATADGFWYELYPEGNDYTKPVIIVTYKLTRGDASSYYALDDDSGSYDPKAGYEIYKFDYRELN